MSPRGWTKLILVAGVLASIATSQATWLVTGEDAKSAVAVAASTTSVRFAITIELTGPAATGNDTYGNVDATVEITTSSTPPGDYLPRVTLKSVSYPDEMPMEVTATLNADGVLRAFPTEPAWLYCETIPCIEQFELTVQLPASPAIVQTVGAFITASAGGSQPEVPDGTRVNVTIEGPL